jgi:hypothetical protein
VPCSLAIAISRPQQVYISINTFMLRYEAGGSNDEVRNGRGRKV